MSEGKILLGLNCFTQHSMLLNDDGMTFLLHQHHPLLQKRDVPKNNTSEADLGRQLLLKIALFYENSKGPKSTFKYKKDYFYLVT